MKKFTAIVCVIFALIMALALPASAATPYQTYTYSIDGKALHSPDAYTPAPDGQYDARDMGMYNGAMLEKYYSDITDKANDIKKAEATLAAAQNELKALMGAGIHSGEEVDAANKAIANAEAAVTTAKNAYNSVIAGKAKITNPADIEVDSELNVYIADPDQNRIIVLDRNYKVKFLISSFKNPQGISDSLSAPQGVYITPGKIVAGEEIPGKIYVCDTGANRLVTFSHDGEFLDIIDAPESEMFEENQVFKPIACAVDNYGRLYVVSTDHNQGIMVMTESGEFTGFVGAQKVSISAWDRIWRRFQTEEQRAQSEVKLSTPFNNITLTGDFIYATITLTDYENEVVGAITSKSKSGDYAPVKMLNAAGDEIMRRNGFYPPSGEVDTKKVKITDEIYGSSTVSDVAVGPEKTWSIIDKKRSKVFTYDFDGNLLFAFGDHGLQTGNIRKDSLVGVTYHGDKMLLLSKSDVNFTFTVYERTEYGEILIRALENQNNRRNDQAYADWTEILKRNSNFDAAYIGRGNALYRSGRYAEAMAEYQSAYDTENYSNAYKELRKEWLSKFILLIPVFVIVVCFACAKFLGYAKKVNKRVSITKGKRTYGQELIYVFHVIFHPFDGYWDLKHEKRGSVRAAITFLALTIVAFYYQAIGQGYIMNPTKQYSTIGGVALSVLVPLALWIVANWCLTTLFDGEGSFKDIFVATCYALLPLVLIMIPTTIASNFVLANEVDILGLLNAIAFIWAGMLLFFGMMVTHDYSMGKNVLITLSTILGMVIIMFIALLFSTLLGKVVGFVTNIVTEIQYRM